MNVSVFDAALRRFANLPALFGERVAYVEAKINSREMRQLTFTESRHIAAVWAERFQDMGLSRGDRIVALLPNSLEFAHLYLAGLQGAFTIVPINWSAPKDEIATLTASVNAKVVVVNGQTLKMAPSFSGLRVWNIDEEGDFIDALLTDNSPGLPFLARAEDMVSIHFTSGTTGTPKGVCHNAGVLLGNVAAFNEHHEFNEKCRFMHVMPMYYMAGFLNSLLSPAIAGASVVIAPQFDATGPMWFWSIARQHEADCFWLSPTMLQSLLLLDRDRESQAYAREHVRTICVGTAPLPAETKAKFEALYGVELFESYGMSEILLITTNAAIFPRVSGSVGRFLPGIEARIVASSAEEKDGPLELRSPFLPVGVLDVERGEMTSFSPEGGWAATGDIACLDDQENLFITGRTKDLIIHGGTNVSPRAVEEVLMHCDGVLEAAVVGVPHDFYGEEVVAVLRVHPSFKLLEAKPAIVRRCRRSLVPQAVPTRYLETKVFPRTSVGKIVKREVKQNVIDNAYASDERTS